LTLSLAPEPSANAVVRATLTGSAAAAETPATTTAAANPITAHTRTPRIVFLLHWQDLPAKNRPGEVATQGPGAPSSSKAT
jgi:hypothetical protein